jgi:hypothetical protein
MPKPKTTRATSRERSLAPGYECRNAKALRHHLPSGSSIPRFVDANNPGNSVVYTEDVVTSFEIPSEASDKEIYFFLLDVLALKYQTLVGVHGPLIREYHGLHCQS